MPTWKELVYRIWGKCSDEDVDFLLWNCTAYPFTSAFGVARQLRDIKKRSGANIGKAGQICNEELDKAMEDLTT